MTNQDVFTVNPAFLNQEMKADFFDFQFVMNADWTLKEAKHNDTILDPAIWQSLFLIREKYFRKVKQHKTDKKKLATLESQKQARVYNKDRLQEHIRKSESKLAEYKNTILAFWKLASCNWITK